jgi:hypothetical protein
MTTRTVSLADVEERKLGDVLREVASEQEVLTIELPEGEAVTIQPVPRLRPLLVLEGYVPEGWKDAINGPGE